MKAPGNLDETELDNLLEFLYQTNTSHLSMRHQQLDFFSSTCLEYSFESINDCFFSNSKAFLQSNALKKKIQSYFQEKNKSWDIVLPCEKVSIFIDSLISIKYFFTFLLK